MLTLIAQFTETSLDIADEAASKALPGTSWVAGGPDAGFSQLITVILTAVFAIAGLLLLLYLIWGGIDWITSAGDSGKLASARNKMMHAVIGVLVLASAFAIIYAMEGVFGLDLLNLETAITSSSSSSKSGSGSGSGTSGTSATPDPASKFKKDTGIPAILKSTP